MEARDIKFGTGAHDRSSQTVSTTQEKSQPGDLGERQHDAGQRCREGAGAHDQDCHLVEGARSDDKAIRKFEVFNSVAPASMPGNTDEVMSTSENVCNCQKELD